MFNKIKFNLLVYLRNRLLWAGFLLTNIIAGIFLVATGYPTAWGMASQYRVTLLPLTFLITLLVLVFLLTEESSSRVDSLLDSYSYPGPAWIIAKAVALAILALLIFTQLLLVGLITQVSVAGETDLGVYLFTWLVYIVPAALWCGALAIAIGLLVGNRLLAAVVVVAYWMAMMFAHKQLIFSTNLDWLILADLVGDSVHANLNHHTRWDFFTPQLLLHRITYLALALALIAFTIGLHKLWRDARFRKAAMVVALAFVIIVVGTTWGLVVKTSQVRAQVNDYAHAIYEAQLAVIQNRETMDFYWGLPDLGWRELAYNLDIDLDVNSGKLAATGDVRFRNVGEATRQLSFTLAHTLEIRELTWQGQNLNWERHGNLVLAQLPFPVSTQEEVSFAINYAGKAHIPVAHQSRVHHRNHLGPSSLHFPHSMGWYPIAHMLVQEEAITNYRDFRGNMEISLGNIVPYTLLVHNPADFAINLSFNGNYPLWTNGTMSNQRITAAENRGLTLTGGMFTEVTQGNFRLIVPGNAPINMVILDWMEEEYNRLQGVIPVEDTQLSILVSDLSLQSQGWFALWEIDWLQGHDPRNNSSRVSTALMSQLLSHWWGGGIVDDSWFFRQAAGTMMADLYHLEQGLVEISTLMDPENLEWRNFHRTRLEQGLYLSGYSQRTVELWLQLLELYQQNGGEHVNLVLNNLHQRYISQDQLTQQDWDELVLGR